MVGENSSLQSISLEVPQNNQSTDTQHNSNSEENEQSYNLVERLPLGVKYFLFLVLLPLAGLYLNKKIAPLFDPSLREEKQNQNPFVKQLDHFLLNEKAITNHTLTAKKAADHLKIPTNDFNHLVQLQYGKSFNKLLQDYRIEAIKEAIANTENKSISIQEILDQFGFSSETDFSNALMQSTRLTIQQFLSQLQTKTDEDSNS